MINTIHRNVNWGKKKPKAMCFGSLRLHDFNTHNTLEMVNGGESSFAAPCTHRVAWFDVFNFLTLSLNLNVHSVFPIDCPRRGGLPYWKWHNFLFRSWISFVSLSVPHSFPNGSYKDHVLASSAPLTL